MNLTQLFFKKLHDQMRIIGLVQSKPKQKVRLDPVDPQDLNVDLKVVRQWSNQNQQLMHLILQNGMATFICNYQFIFEFYQSLIFKSRQITSINSSTLNFTNLKVLNLCQNNIKVIENIPQNCEELYLDFNHINQIVTKSKINNSKLALLSVSNNLVNDKLLQIICKSFSSLRCLNVSYNKIQDIRSFVQNIRKLQHIKILYSLRNPIFLLKIYYEYITTSIQLKIFDNQKYVKPEPPKKVKQEVKPPQPVKQEKKDAKKDTKKGGKVQQKPVQVVVPIVEQKIPQPKQLTENDYTKCQLNVKISNFQNFSGSIYQTSIFGIQNLDIRKCQTTYWISYFLFGKKYQTYEKRVQFDSITTENEQNRLDFFTTIKQQFDVNVNNLNLFQDGIVVYVHKQEPIVSMDPQSNQPKPQIEDNEPVMKSQIIGSVYVDLRQLYKSKSKNIEKKYGLWEEEIANQPLFKNKYLDEKDHIQKRRQALQEKIKKQEQELKKKLQEEQAQKAQKKGKDTKKAADKKPPPGKKDGKDAVNQQKKKIQKCSYQIQERKYSYIGGDSLQKKRKEHLAVKLWIE